MTKHFQNEIDRLKKKILELTAVVEKSLQMAVRSVTEGDVALAEKVIASDSDVDDIEVDVEEECLKILALHQPVAADLRYVVGVLKINNDLERIGDLAVNIAKRAREFPRLQSGNRVPIDLGGLCSRVQKLVKNSADALVQSDPKLARQVLADDDEIDDRHRETIRTVQEQIGKHPDQGPLLLSLLSVSRYLERIADHATNIAEDVIYMVEGEIVRHQGG